MFNLKKLEMKLFILIASFLLCAPFVYSQIKLDNSEMVTQKGKFVKEIKIKKGEKVQFADSLVVSLDYFSHKDTYEGDEGMAMIYLTVAKGTVSEKIMLSAHGPDRKTGKLIYGTSKWKEYTFELKQYNYDIDIEVIVSNNK